MKASVLVKDVILNKIRKNDIKRFEGVIPNIATLHGNIIDINLRYYFDGGFDAKLVDRVNGETLYAMEEEWVVLDIPGISGPKAEFYQRYTLDEMRKMGANI